MRNTFEKMMSNKEMRSKMFESKKKVRKVVVKKKTVPKENPQRIDMSNWLRREIKPQTGENSSDLRGGVVKKGGGVAKMKAIRSGEGGSGQKLKLNQVYHKERSKSENTDRNTDMKKVKTLTEWHDKKNEEKNLQPRKIENLNTQDKVVQKEIVLKAKIQQWDQFFSSERAVIKIGGTDSIVMIRLTC